MWLMFSTFPSSSQMPVMFYHSVIHGLGFFICQVSNKNDHLFDDKSPIKRDLRGSNNITPTFKLG